MNEHLASERRERLVKPLRKHRPGVAMLRAQFPVSAEKLSKESSWGVVDFSTKYKNEQQKWAFTDSQWVYASPANYKFVSNSPCLTKFIHPLVAVLHRVRNNPPLDVTSGEFIPRLEHSSLANQHNRTKFRGGAWWCGPKPHWTDPPSGLDNYGLGWRNVGEWELFYNNTYCTAFEEISLR